MSMHIVGPWLSTISTKKKKEKITKSRQEELERDWRDRNKRLKEMRLPKETFEQFLEWVYGKGSKAKSTAKNLKGSPSAGQNKTHTNSKAPSGVIRETEHNASGANVSSKTKEWITGPVSSKPSPVYTGTKVLGIGTMHKSNAVPIFSDDEAIEISTMRR